LEGAGLDLAGLDLAGLGVLRLAVRQLLTGLALTGLALTGLAVRLLRLAVGVLGLLTVRILTRLGLAVRVGLLAVVAHGDKISA